MINGKEFRRDTHEDLVIAMVDRRRNIKNNSRDF